MGVLNMTKNLFKEVAMNETNPNYSKAISRLEPLYQRSNDLRSEFGRDYTRIIFSQAYRRLRHRCFLQLRMIMFVHVVNMLT